METVTDSTATNTSSNRSNIVSILVRDRHYVPACLVVGLVLIIFDGIVVVVILDQSPNGRIHPGTLSNLGEGFALVFHQGIEISPQQDKISGVQQEDSVVCLERALEQDLGPGGDRGNETIDWQAFDSLYMPRV